LEDIPADLTVIFLLVFFFFQIKASMTDRVCHTTDEFRIIIFLTPCSLMAHARPPVQTDYLEIWST